MVNDKNVPKTKLYKLIELIPNSHCFSTVYTIKNSVWSLYHKTINYKLRFIKRCSTNDDIYSFLFVHFHIALQIQNDFFLTAKKNKNKRNL